MFYRHVVRVPGELSVLPVCGLRVSRASEILVHHWRRLGVHLWLWNGFLYEHTMLDYTTTTQLHLQYVTTGTTTIDVKTF